MSVREIHNIYFLIMIILMFFVCMYIFMCLLIFYD